MEYTPAASAAQALEEIGRCYQDYIETLQHCRSNSFNEIMESLFRSQGNPKVAHAVEEFDGIITGRIAALAELLAQCPAEEAGQLALQALEQVLFYRVYKDTTISFSLAAFEGRAFPLLPFLSPEQRQEVAGRYARRTPPRRMLPNQKKLWKELMQR